MCILARLVFMICGCKKWALVFGGNIRSNPENSSPHLFFKNVDSFVFFVLVISVDDD